EMRSGMRKQGLPDSESSRGQGRMRMTQRVGEVVLCRLSGGCYRSPLRVFLLCEP
ncbi:MAG: hypothetical protein K0S37_3845, partial [Microbacterium sp.]|nr:hypothetical protein [Microbacterium sp.]